MVQYFDEPFVTALEDIANYEYDTETLENVYVRSDNEYNAKNSRAKSGFNQIHGKGRPDGLEQLVSVNQLDPEKKNIDIASFRRDYSKSSIDTNPGISNWGNNGENIVYMAIGGLLDRKKRAESEFLNYYGRNKQYSKDILFDDM